MKTALNLRAPFLKGGAYGGVEFRALLFEGFFGKRDTKVTNSFA
jgi:hypothetical protein